jgi:hypothetical protein
MASAPFCPVCLKKMTLRMGTNVTYSLDGKFHVGPKEPYYACETCNPIDKREQHESPSIII